MIYYSDQTEEQAMMQTAQQMAAAARTAPKACGTDHLYCVVVDGEEKARLAEAMRRYGKEWSCDFMIRDGDTVDFARCVVILGMIESPIGLRHCGFCGFENCGECAKAHGRCAHNVIDLGIAIGSAVSVAADCRIDNRVLYSAGRAAAEMGMLPEGVEVAVGIPLSTGSKNPFFDRESGDHAEMMRREKERRLKNAAKHV